MTPLCILRVTESQESSGKLLPQKVGGFLVAGLLSSGHNFPLGGNERILPLLHEAAYLIVP